jgi:hypothetical protein
MKPSTISPNAMRMWLAWTLGGGVVGAALFAIAEALLVGHFPVGVGVVLGGIIIGAVLGKLITRTQSAETMAPTQGAAFARGLTWIWSAPATAMAMAFLIGAILVPSLGLALLATVCALAAGALLRSR